MSSSDPDLKLTEFWLLDNLKSRVYQSGLSNLWELKDAILREMHLGHLELLHSGVVGFVISVKCVILCGGSHVEYIQL